MALIATFFIAFTLGFASILGPSIHASHVIYIWLVLFIALGVAYQCSELILSTILRPNTPPRQNRPSGDARVAVLYVTCDDVIPELAIDLSRQTYPMMDIFVLDDSQSPTHRALVDLLPYPILRRPDRRGFKAGNLNNWLTSYGHHYEYIVVCDADSKLPVNAVMDMVSYAEHPDNGRIAIFETIIRAWNPINRFVEAQNDGGRVGDWIKLRVDNRLHRTLSTGHNNLYRTSALSSIGGFDERYLAEDFATAANLSRTGFWRTMTIPVLTYERLPENLHEYARRQARWAIQTFQLTSIDANGLSTNIQLKLVFALHHYACPLVCFLGMLLSLVYAICSWSEAALLFSDTDRIGSGQVVAWTRFWLTFYFLPLLLRAAVHVRSGQPVTSFVRSILLQTALFLATIWPIAKRLWAARGSRALDFTVTGTSSAPSLSQIFRMGWPSFTLAWALTVAVLPYARIGFVSLVWLIPCSAAPFLIYRYQSLPDA